MSFQIAIDGPSGVGKSTISKLLAHKLSFIYVDTGAMYRTVGYYCFLNDINVENHSDVENVLDDINLEIKYIDGTQHIFLNGTDVQDEIRSQAMSDYASKVGAIPAVREKLVLMQREMGEKTDVVMDGRDVGSVILKNADLKIYLDASTEEKTRRKLKELKAKGTESDYETVFKEFEIRDFRDKNREVNPLVQCEDAIYIDSSDLTLEEVAETVLTEYKKIVE